MLSWVLLGLIGVIILIVIITKGIKILKGDEMAVLERFGKPIEFRDSGLNFIIPFIDELIVYPKTRFAFEYIVECFTKEEESETGYKGIPVTLTVTAYVNFPREKRTSDELPPWKTEETHPLIIIRKNNIPRSEEGLKEYIGGIIESIVRTTIGRISYSTLLTEKEKVEEELKEHLKDPEGELILSGFSAKGLSIVIEKIELPEELKKRLALYEIEKKEAEAAPWEAEQRTIETVGAIAKSLYPEFSVKEAMEKFAREYNKEEKLKLAKELIEKEMAIKRQAFKHIHITGSGTGELAKIGAEIGTGIAATLQTMREKTEERVKKREEEKKEKKMTEVEAMAYIHKQYEKWKKNQK